MTNVPQKKDNINTWLSEINVDHKLAVSVDCVIFGYSVDGLMILLMNCNMPPYEGKDSLIGDLVHADESLNQTAERILKEKANLEDIYVEQVEVFSKVDRHPISRVITVAYNALVNMDEVEIHDAENRGLTWKPISAIYDMAYDHIEILTRCFDRLKLKLVNQPIEIDVLPEKFTINELQKVYEVILDIKIDKRNFRRKVNDLNLLIEHDEMKSGVKHRPAKLYSFNTDLKNQNLNIIPNYKN